MPSARAASCGFVMQSDRHSLTVLKVLSLAGGLSTTAKGKCRNSAATSRKPARERAIDLKNSQLKAGTFRCGSTWLYVPIAGSMRCAARRNSHCHCHQVRLSGCPMDGSPDSNRRAGVSDTWTKNHLITRDRAQRGSRHARPLSPGDDAARCLLLNSQIILRKHQWLIISFLSLSSPCFIYFRMQPFTMPPRALRLIRKYNFHLCRQWHL